MANSKIIIIEGAQGVGKTTITDFIRNTIPYTNLYRLCGTSDSSPTGFDKAKNMYIDFSLNIKVIRLLINTKKLIKNVFNHISISSGGCVCVLKICDCIFQRIENFAVQ